MNNEIKMLIGEFAFNTLNFEFLLQKVYQGLRVRLKPII